MIDFIDKTESASGTALNRLNLMKVQGMEAYTVESSNGVITQTFSDGSTLVTQKNASGAIVQVFTGYASGLTITKTTQIINGVINVTVS